MIKFYLSAGVVDNLLTAVQITLETAAQNLHKGYDDNDDGDGDDDDMMVMIMIMIWWWWWW